MAPHIIHIILTAILKQVLLSMGPQAVMLPDRHQAGLKTSLYQQLIHLLFPAHTG